MEKGFVFSIFYKYLYINLKLGHKNAHDKLQW